MTPIRFGEPVWLFLLLLLIPIFLLAWRARAGQSRGMLITSFTLRSLVIILLTMTLAQPTLVQRGDGLTVTVILDRSRSIPVPLKRFSERFLDEAAEASRQREDRVAVITVARDATISALPTATSTVEAATEPAELGATNLAAGLKLAMAVMPDDTANKVIVASDGNETEDSILNAAQLATANGVPIDVLLLEYDYENEVVFEELIVPATARIGQSVRLNMLLRSRASVNGRVELDLNGGPVDLNGDEPGTAINVSLEPGTNPLEQEIQLDNPGPHVFSARFFPDDVVKDGIVENNEAVGVTFVGGTGRVLVIDDTGGEESQHVVRALQSAGLGVEINGTANWPGGIVYLSSFDCVVVVNMPIYGFERGQDEMLYTYVHDLGGGLVMIGGDRAFGAGGWIDSRTEEALPLQLNPPQTRQMPAGALAIVMHSCEMANGNFWGQVVAESAINAMSRLDYAGIIEYTWGGGANTIQGCGWAHPMSRLGDKSAALAATKTMSVGDMPDFNPGLQLAVQGLNSVPAAQRHCIIISDGDPQAPLPGTVGDLQAAQISVTTVMVGGHGTQSDMNMMQQLAAKTGGNFYNVTDPKLLPQIFFKEASTISRSLIQDGRTFNVARRATASGPAIGRGGVPTVDGYVLAAPREGLAQTSLWLEADENSDPLFASWNFGLGRSVAFTSDVTGRWGSQWIQWSGFETFWEQTVRWAMRPSTPANIEVTTTTEGDRAIVEMEALDVDAGAINFLSTKAVVVKADGTAVPLAMTQVGPGRYRGEFQTSDTGAYLVNIMHESPGADGAKVAGSVQAAVTVPFAREFEATTHNAALLESLASSTGGRVLNSDDPILTGLFDREELVVPESPRPIWYILAIVAASLLLLDIAARRIAFDRSAIEARLKRAAARREAGSTGSVDALRRVQDGGSSRTIDPATGRSTGTSGEPKRVRIGDEAKPTDTRGVRFEATDEDRDNAIDVSADPLKAGDRPARSTPTRARDDAPDPNADPADRMARLREARRRARESNRDADAGGGNSDGDDAGHDKGGGA